jgi:anti-anti-sigma factor
MSSSLTSGADTVSSNPEHADCHAANFCAHSPEPSLAVVSAHGELDAANAQGFVTYALRHAAPEVCLVLDLTGIEFFGTAAFSALHTFNVRCVGAGAEWILVPSRAVTRLLRICDPDATFPVCDDLDAALAEARAGSHRLLQLVAKPR